MKEKYVRKITQKDQLQNGTKTQKGITLLALVITIIVLLILAGITIGAITGDNGIIGNAGKAKEEAEIANEKEILEKATVQAMGSNKYGNIEEAELQDELDKETGEGKTEATDIGEEFEVVFKESNRYYTVNKDGNVGEAQDIIEDKYPGDITVGRDGETLDGSEAHPYEIWCVEDLVAFSNMVDGSGIVLENGEPVQVTTANGFGGKYIVLKASLNFKSKLSYQNSERTDFGDINGNTDDGNTLINEMTTGTGFKPIGMDGRKFSGNFNGKGYKIYNLFIDYSQIETNQNVGLFGTITSAKISNLEISGQIKGNWETAGIAGYITSGEFDTCINKADIIGHNHVGGIAGYGKGTVKVTNCENYGNIKFERGSYADSGAGGIVGALATEIENCFNYGNVQGNGNCAGIIGVGATTSIINCYNEGKIETENNNSAGGICAYNRGGKMQIVNCYNKGEIKGFEGAIAGLVGTSSGGNIEWEMSLDICNSYNVGKISGNRIVAGLLGSQGTICAKNYVTIMNSWNIGELEGNKSGGILGIIGTDYRTDTKTNIENTFYSNEVGIPEGNTYTGTIIQKSKSEFNSESFVNILNGYIDENESYPIVWKKWKLGEEGYPVFE